MDFIGSKKKVNDWIFKIIKNTLSSEDYSKYVFLDGCAGAGSTSIYASDLGFRVVSNDLLHFSKSVVDGYVNLTRDNFNDVVKHINKMNNLNGVNGFFFKNYSEYAGRLFFTNYNALKIDACRLYIETIENDVIENYLIYCLLEAVSRVSNTMGVYAAFKKEFKKTSLNHLKINPEKCNYQCNATVFTMDIIELLKSKKIKENILYIDPPYNSRQYGPNYHIYETLVKYDNPKIKIHKNKESIAGLRDDWVEEYSSDFCKKSEVKKMFTDIIKNTSAKYIYISYNSDGILKLNDFELLLMEELSVKNLTIYVKPHDRYISDTNPDKKYNKIFLREYLIEIIK